QGFNAGRGEVGLAFGTAPRGSGQKPGHDGRAWTPWRPNRCFPAGLPRTGARSTATPMIGARIRPFRTSVVLPDGLPIAGEILLSHLRGIDAQARPVHAVGAAIPAETARQVRAKL